MCVSGIRQTSDAAAGMKGKISQTRIKSQGHGVHIADDAHNFFQMSYHFAVTFSSPNPGVGCVKVPDTLTHQIV